MKFALALHFQNEERWLRLHLPKLLESASVDGICAIDGGSTDGGADFIRSIGGTVMNRPFDFTDAGGEQNALLDFVQLCGYDMLLHTAPDELWFPEHLDLMKAYMETGRVRSLMFPTYNFVRDRLHHCPIAPYHPDPHVRVWLTEDHVRYPDGLHTQPQPDQTMYCDDIYLYHYADIKPRRQRELLALNRDRGVRGEMPLPHLPEGHGVTAYPYHEPFGGNQPLDPHEVGIYAPYTLEEVEAGLVNHALG